MPAAAAWLSAVCHLEFMPLSTTVGMCTKKNQITSMQVMQGLAAGGAMQDGVTVSLTGSTNALFRQAFHQ